MKVKALNKRERKKALSGQRKNQKKSKKTILILPDSFNIKNPELHTSNISKLTSLLENLLPIAKLPQNAGRECKKNKFEKGCEEENLSEIRLKRNQLLLGINVVSKGVTNNIAACVIFANDIFPKLMTTHLKVLCSSKKIPYVSMPNFRELTKNALGFPCIALGIRKDSVDFNQIKELICSAMKDEEFMEDDYSDNDVMLVKISNEKKNKKKDDAKMNKEPFAYLYRNRQSGKREFVPESRGKTAENADKKGDFIPIAADNKEAEANEKHTNRKRGRKNKRKILTYSNTESETRYPVEYSMSKIIKLDGNPSRESDKYKRFQ